MKTPQQLEREKASIRATNDILAERNRQVEEEKFHPSHDDINTERQLASAAACYAISGSLSKDERGTDPIMIEIVKRLWPVNWAWKWWKPQDPRRDLVKAGALILAEIERLDRQEGKNDGS